MRNTNRYEIFGDCVAIITRSGARILVDKEALKLVKDYTWCTTGTGYAMSRSLGNAVLMHRLLAGASRGDYVDHINGDALDNRRQNLRLCSKQQNEFNTKIRTDNTTGYRGVCKGRRGKFRAYIVKDGHQFHLGEFEKAVDAAKAYNEKAAELFGEFARLNTVSS